MRELTTVAVVDLAQAAVRWWWGADELSGPHQPSVLPDGRVLLFDNGVDRRRTRLVAVDPGTREVVWSWSANPPESFFCPLAGGCELWQLFLPVEVYGADRGLVSIYRMSAVAPDIVARLRKHASRNPAGPPQATARDPIAAAATDPSPGR